MVAGDEFSLIRVDAYVVDCGVLASSAEGSKRDEYRELYSRTSCVDEGFWTEKLSGHVRIRLQVIPKIPDFNGSVLTAGDKPFSFAVELNSGNIF